MLSMKISTESMRGTQVIDCPVCTAIVDEVVQTTAEVIFDKSKSMPQMTHAVSLPCENCGRTWTLTIQSLDGEDDYIPEGAVLVSGSHAEELSELEAREALEGFDDGLERLMRGE